MSVLHALRHEPDDGAPVDLDVRGLAPGEAVRRALALLRERRFEGALSARCPPGDPAGGAVAGLLRVAAAEESPALRVRIVPEALLVRVPASPGPARAPVVEVPSLPDAPLRTIDPEQAAVGMAQAWASVRGEGVRVVSVDHLVGRPFSGPTAALAGAVWESGPGVLACGPTDPRHAAPDQGVFALSAAEREEALATARHHPTERWAALHVDWARAVAAFPHVRPIAASLLATPGPREVLDGVREELGRVLGSPSPPLKVPVRDLGLDSVGAVDLRIALERRFGVALPATLVFEAPTVSALAERVAQVLRT
ncbi:MAG: hypothetical protein H6738_19675 [Alphaproteobacteria bacterium]|nr:hypothetical protein [Alphaproteobacteria bacterium]